MTNDIEKADIFTSVTVDPRIASAAARVVIAACADAGLILNALGIEQR